MKCFQLKIMGNWGHFKRPETNNNPLSHDMITKTALIGLIGAVLGIEREDMKMLFPQFSEDLMYNVQLLHPVKKVPVSMTSRKAINPIGAGTPKSFEVLKAPAFLVTIALKSSRSEKYFDAFQFSIENNNAVYPPVLGWHNCPADLYFVSVGVLSDEQKGVFETKGFVLAKSHKFMDISSLSRIGFDKIPTYQNDDFWNLPDRYVDIVYPDYPGFLKVEGKYREYMVEGKEIEKLCLI